MVLCLALPPLCDYSNGVLTARPKKGLREDKEASEKYHHHLILGLSATVAFVRFESINHKGGEHVKDWVGSR